MVDFIKMIDCGGCPCLNNDYENGCSCNLDYNTKLMWRKNKELVECSDNCELESVKFGSEIFEKDISEVTKVRPENW